MSWPMIVGIIAAVAAFAVTFEGCLNAPAGCVGMILLPLAAYLAAWFITKLILMVVTY